MAEPVTTAIMLGLAIRGTRVAANVTEDFLKRTLAPVADATGGVLAQPILDWKRRREQRVARLVGEAADLLEQNGKAVQAVPGRLIFPILERGSIEDGSEDLRRKWVHLLANAADQDNIDAIPAAVPYILAELSPIDARILDYVYAHGDENSGVYPCDPQAICEAFGLQMHEVSVPVQNLTRLGLLSVPLGTIPRLATGQVDTGEYYGTTYLTSLGYTFIASCTFDLGQPDAPA